jgi:F0F1-type ATP synthase membrane subunit c/vacuolar-type H+-ATPase subunit K
MLKNMTRKSLALGAGLALVASGLTAAPAQAVATGQLWSAFGQTNEMVGVMGHDFGLRFGNPATRQA